MQLFSEMKSRGITPDPPIYEFLLQQAQEPERLESSFALLVRTPSMLARYALAGANAAQTDPASVRMHLCLT
jgi:hypothetical protein